MQGFTDEQLRKMAEAELIQWEQVGRLGRGTEHVRYAQASAELRRRDREHQSEQAARQIDLAAKQLHIAETQASAAKSSAQSSARAMWATWGMVFLGALTLLGQIFLRR